MNDMNCFLGIDIGGSWIKGMLFAHEGSMSARQIAEKCRSKTIVKVKSNLGEGLSVDDFIESLARLFTELEVEQFSISGIGISTAGIVKYDGSGLSLCASHLSALLSPEWQEYLKRRLKAPVIVINDAEAAAIGAAALGYLSGMRCYGIAPIGTGLGFVVLRNGRRWGLNGTLQLPLLGSVYSPEGNFDMLASASRLAYSAEANTLNEIVSDKKYRAIRDKYLDHLAGIFYSSAILYGVEEICIGGGLANAAEAMKWDIEQELNKRLAIYPRYDSESPQVHLLKEGNQLPLIGAILLARGTSYAIRYRRPLIYSEMQTEKPYDSSLMLNKMSTTDILDKLFDLEQTAGYQLKKSLPILGVIIDQIVSKLADQGRLIYVGCGTSGRLAAIDAVELACTFSFPREKILTFISGGIADAAIDIEKKFEEDASAVPELLMANITSKDVVIGISVSGKAYYVQSALAYAKAENATTVMIQAVPEENLPFCEYVLPLHSGAELIAGSTRMKAGTATKKLLNFLSTTIMIKLGKVHGSYMTELECLNEKLVERAINILISIFNISQEEALSSLIDNDYNLWRAIQKVSSCNLNSEK